ncbi:MAG: carboxypeptidase-like regulatory domain-containing protein, partial [Cyclobacteriaceae bacterium]
MNVFSIKRSVLILLLQVGFFYGFAQDQRKVTGVVTSVDGETLIGVTISIKNSSRGAVTDLNGSYAIQV